MYKQIDKPKEKKLTSIGQSVSQKRNSVKQAVALVNNQPEASAWKSLKTPKILQMGGAVHNPNAPKNYESIGYGIQGVLAMINNVGTAPNPVCNIGVMARYPIGSNYWKGKGGHAAFQVDADLNGDGTDHQYLQVGVSATGSIQTEPKFNTIKTKEGYNIKRATKTVTKENCINSLNAVATEIATEQPYKERIYFNTGSHTNCALWASKMAKQAGLNLDVDNKWFLPSPNDLQKEMRNIDGKDGVTVQHETEIKDADGEIKANVGLVPDPEFHFDENENVVVTNTMGKTRTLHYINNVGGNIT